MDIRLKQAEPTLNRVCIVRRSGLASTTLVLLLLGMPVHGEQDAAPVSHDPAARAAYVAIGGVRIHYLDWGGAGPPIILVPGGCETPYVFGDLAPLLKVHARVLGVTPRGCGASGSADGYTIDQQIHELIGFLDALGIQRATFAGHSSGGGKVVRLARLYPARVHRLVTFDIVYSGIPDDLEPRLAKAIASRLELKGDLSLDTARREFQAWELGAWSGALERNLLETTEPVAGGGLRYKPGPPEWQKTFIDDMRAGRYFENAITHPALFIVAHHLDSERLAQFPAPVRKQLQPLADAVASARRQQLRGVNYFCRADLIVAAQQLRMYHQNGSHVQVRSLAKTSHYPFVDKPNIVAELMLRFIRQHCCPN